jgi:hypothetical protein
VLQNEQVPDDVGSVAFGSNGCRHGWSPFPIISAVRSGRPNVAGICPPFGQRQENAHP